ncbi:hypothetical protein BJ322DRAFT_1108575 [Thelephora terrestris]|uniref:Uncharacterized protein n=1 Tax=Thelephora terrestris TaxID=56493 RepID=A0A9P6L717_9AGAM|nr:hypothetical protein BJ322DRAFT_1108575 [Thelephora terrestris]
MALGIAAPFDWRSELFSVHYSLAKLFCTESVFDDADAHIELAKSHTVDDAYDLGLVMEMQAWIWYRQRRAEDARCEALRGLEVYEKLGAERDMGKCRNLLRQIEKSIETQIFPEEKGSQYIGIVNCSLPTSGEDSPETPLEDADGYFIDERNAVRSLFPKHVL